MTDRARRPCLRAAMLALLGLQLHAPIAAAEEAPAEATPVRLMLLWQPQAQFAGYYVAKEKGYYSRRGLDVDVLAGGPSGDPLRALVEGTTDFAVLWLTSALVARGQGRDIAHVAQVFQRSHLGVVGWKDRGIHRLQDLAGKRVSVWEDPFRPLFQALFDANGITPTIVPQYATVNLFLLRGVDACSVMEYNEYHLIYLAGVDEDALSFFPLREHGLDFPEDGLYCSGRTREQRPALCRAMAEASMEGWRFALDHPEETVEIVMKRVEEAKLPTNRAHMMRMLRAVLPSVFPGEAERPEAETKPGELSRDDYERTRRWLVERSRIEDAPDYEEFVR